MKVLIRILDKNRDEYCDIERKPHHIQTAVGK